MKNLQAFGTRNDNCKNWIYQADPTPEKKLVGSEVLNPEVKEATEKWGREMKKSEIWGTKAQNELARELLKQKMDIREVQRGDTLGAIVTGLLKKVNYYMPVEYRGESKGMKKAAEKNPKGVIKDANYILPGMYVWIEDGKVIVSDKLTAKVKTEISEETVKNSKSEKPISNKKEEKAESEKNSPKKENQPSSKEKEIKTQPTAPEKNVKPVKQDAPKKNPWDINLPWQITPQDKTRMTPPVIPNPAIFEKRKTTSAKKDSGKNNQKIEFPIQIAPQDKTRVARNNPPIIKKGELIVTPKTTPEKNKKIQSTQKPWEPLWPGQVKENEKIQIPYAPKNKIPSPKKIKPTKTPNKKLGPLQFEEEEKKNPWAITFPKTTKEKPRVPMAPKDEAAEKAKALEKLQADATKELQDFLKNPTNKSIEKLLKLFAPKGEIVFETGYSGMLSKNKDLEGKLEEIKKGQRKAVEYTFAEDGIIFEPGTGLIKTWKVKKELVTQ